MYQNTIQRGGYTLLEHVTPTMLRNAILAHGGIDKIHGFENFQGAQAILVLETLRDIAKQAPRKRKTKKKTTKKKKGKQAAAGGGANDDDDDDGIMAMAELTLDQRLAQEYNKAKAAGDVLCIDMDSDDDEGQAPSLAPEVVMQPVVDLADEEEEEEEEEVEEVQAWTAPSRLPADGDIILIKWAGDPKEYLCRVQDSGSVLQLVSADLSFTQVLDFHPASDDWRFSTLVTQEKSKKKKVKVAANPRAIKAKASQGVSASNAFEGLKFCVTGMTQQMNRDVFSNTAKAIIEAKGGKVTGGVSGKTDYLVAGTLHHNPFRGTTGPIENGSKYIKAMSCPNCKVIDMEGLEELAKSVGKKKLTNFFPKKKIDKADV